LFKSVSDRLPFLVLLDPCLQRPNLFTNKVKTLIIPFSVVYPMIHVPLSNQVALAVDTCNFLQQSQQRQQQVPSIPIGSHLLITMNETFFPGTLRPILFNWINSVLHITKDNGTANSISVEAYPASDNLPIGHYTAFWECMEFGTPPTMGNPQRLSQKAQYTIQRDPNFSILGAHNVHIYFLTWTVS
jgi:hypothetical protein